MMALIGEYEKELLGVAAFAEKTVENYVSCVLSYYEYARDYLKLHITESKGVHICKWIEKLKNTGISYSRLQHHQSALKTFFALMIKLDMIQDNPAEALPPVRRLSKGSRCAVSSSIAYKLLGIIDQSTWFGKRDFVIISMLWSLGLRISELTSLTVGSFDKGFDPVNKIGLLRVRGKNKKQRALFVVDKLYDSLIEYLSLPESPKKNREPLFIIAKGSALSNNRIQKMIKENTAKAKIKEHITPHVLRHCFATEMYHQGVPISAIQAMLGHSTVAETSVYIHVSDQFKKLALDQIAINGGRLWR